MPSGSPMHNVTVADDDDESTTRTVMSLTDLPLTFTVTGAGASGTTRAAIEREDSYFLEKPDGTTGYSGFAGETIALVEQTGEASITITKDDLIGTLDDGAKYRIVATVADGLGQTATAQFPAEDSPFEVHWEHQAIMPGGTASVSDYVSFITPTAPSGTQTGDVCDIYRLSADKAELIYPNAQFGTMYVDPYPTIGEFGGHRIVFKTKNGDYTTGTDIAWYDIEEHDVLECNKNIIDFNGNRLFLHINADISHSWSKDFKETKYLGGSVQGDWNPAVSRTGTLGFATINAEDADTIQKLRELATYAGACHVRTIDGSSYPANIDVKEDTSIDTAYKTSSFTLDITRVDPEGYDGMTYEEWIDEE